VRTEERLDPETMAWSLATLLGHLPDAMVGALDDDASFVAMPGSVPLTGQAVVCEGSLADLVAADDAIVVTRTWEQVRASGLAQSNVRLTDGRTAIVHAFDVHEAHGVVVAVAELLHHDLFAPPFADGPAGALRPRVCHMRHNVVGAVTEVDEAAVALLGWTLDELAGRRPSELVHPDDFDEMVAAWIQMLQRPGGTGRSRGRHRCRDGRWLWVEVTHRNLLFDRAHLDVASEVVDISEEMAARESLAERDDLLGHLTGPSSGGVLHLDASGAVRFANERLLELFGVTSAASTGELLAHVGAGDRRVLLAAVAHSLADGARAEVELGVGTSRPAPPRVCRVVTKPLRGAAGAIVGVVASATDLVDTAPWPPA
jgi:PAS domain S-box-containing protein